MLFHDSTSGFTLIKYSLRQIVRVKALHAVPVFTAGQMAGWAVLTEAANAPAVSALAPATYTGASPAANLALGIDTVLC